MATVDHGRAAPCQATPPPSRGGQINPGILTMVFFIGSEVMLFGVVLHGLLLHPVQHRRPVAAAEPERRALRAAEAHHRRQHRRSWWRRASPSTGASTGCKHYNDRKGLERGLIVTILLGATFLIIQINEYIHLGFTPQDTAFGSTFYIADRRARPARLRGPHDPDALPHPRGAGTRLHAAWSTPLGAAQPLLALRRRRLGDPLRPGLPPMTASPSPARPSRRGSPWPSAGASLSPRAAGAASEPGDLAAGKTTVRQPLRELPHAGGRRHAAGVHRPEPRRLVPRLARGGHRGRRSSPASSSAGSRDAQKPMPRDLVKGQDAANVAAYIASVAGTTPESAIFPATDDPRGPEPAPPGTGPVAGRSVARPARRSRVLVDRRLPRPGPRAGRGLRRRGRRGWW